MILESVNAVDGIGRYKRISVFKTGVNRLNYRERVLLARQFGLARYGRTEYRFGVINEVSYVAIGNAENLGVVDVADVCRTCVEHSAIVIVLDGNTAKEERRRYLQYVAFESFDVVIDVVYDSVFADGNLELIEVDVADVDRLLIVGTEREFQRVIVVVEREGEFAEFFVEREGQQLVEYRLYSRLRYDYRNRALGELDTVKESRIPRNVVFVAFAVVGRVGILFFGAFGRSALACRNACFTLGSFGIGFFRRVTADASDNTVYRLHEAVEHRDNGAVHRRGERSA